MFFKTEKKENMEAANNACWITFFFWGVILFLNSIFEMFFNKQFISNSITILISGLIIFFLSDFIIKKRKES
ncbi:hypothetical protein ACIQHV_32380 [Bacillus bombysepticus]|uniref:Uncharacterized protein n=1 Tax=Bacillus thuringiensis serovar kumamotoensis TaxID=132267 RepID=A0A9X6JHU9_BACUK|nr:hypothetical protein [Bacillus thuringiensis]MEC2869561.1 hypothetical protein [Bacillus cereus]OTZ66213.1 hypothetical protein BK769_32975 [Bacillus thuringiensis serovar kumamtoensis]